MFVKCKKIMDRFLETMWNNSKEGMDQESWKEVGRTKMDDMTRTLFAAFDTHFVTSKSLKNNSDSQSEDRLWTYTTAIFFTTTLLTTIGNF